MAGPVGCLAAAGAQQQLAGLGMNLRGLGHTVLGWAGPAADFCANATYEHRLDNPDEYNYCSVPGGGPDAFLFAALAVLLACCLHFSSLSAVWVLVAGAIAEGLVFPFNLGRLGNAFTLWLGIDPPEVFFYAFLPPLLLDSALSIDYFLFHKVMPQVFVFAFLVVILSAFLTTPVLLYVLGLAAHGWRWQHGALFSAMLASTDALAISAVLRHASGPESLVTLLEGESLLNDASGIVLFDLFRRLVLQLPEGGEGREDAPSLLSVLPLLGAEVARLAAGGVAVGLVAGALTRRLLRVLRWHGASTSQEVAAILAGGYLVFYTANSPLQVSGVIAVVVYGLYGNAYSHFELGSSRHMHELAAVQGTVAFALNGIVFFFAGASAVNFLIRAVEQVADYRHSFALFPPIYLALVLIRGLCIALFNPLFRLLGRQALPARAVLFVTWGGLRGAISLIMVQAIATDDKVVSQARLVSAQMALWASLFVLSTLLVNAPSVPAVLRFTGLDQVSPVKLRIREKAKRALLRYTAAAIQDLKADEDEMLRGVDWATVASYVDLSEELSLFDSSTSGAAGQPGDQGPGGQQDAQQQEHHGAEARAAAPATLPAQAAASQLQEGEGLFESPGWAAPSAERGSTGRRRAAALSALGNVSTNLALNSSRRLLGASYANLTQKWESRSPHAPAAADASAEDTAEEGGSSGEGEDLEAPLLPSAGAQQARRDAAGRKAPLRRISTVTSISSSSAGGMGTHGSVGGSKDMGSARSRAPGTEGLSKYGSGDFSDEAPFWSGQATAPQAHRLAGAKSAPLMHAIVEVGTSSEEESADSDGEGVPWQASQAGPQPGRQPSEAPPPRPLLLPEDSSNALLHSSPPRQHHQPLHTPHQHTPLQTPRQQAPSQQQHFASLDFETGLPSFPSDAAWSVAEPAPPLLTDVGAGTSGLDFELLLPSSPRRATAGRAADTNQLEAFVQPATPVAAPAPVLPPLRLGRASAPLPDLRTSQAAASGPGSPRQPGSARAAALAGEGGQPSMPLSPRSMHGLVRTSLLPAAADRQAVMHVGELIGGEAEESAARQRQTGMTRIPSLPASPRGQPAAAAAEAPSQPQQTGSWQPQRTLKHTASAGGRLRTGASRLGSGLSSSSAASSGSGGAIFSGLNQPAPARTGLAALFKPPSPGKISPLASAASSPEPAEVGEAPQEKDEVTEPAAEQASVGPAVAQASGGGSRVAAAEQSLLPPLPQLDSLPHPLRSASQPDLAAGTPAEAGDSGAAAPPEMVPDLGEAADAAASAVPPGLPTLPSSAAAAEAASPAQREHARSYSAALPSHEELAVLPDLLVGSPPSHRHFGSSRSQTPAAGAGMAVATAAGSHGSTVKPWQTGAMLLRRSMSTPLSGIAELLEAAGSAGPSTEAGGSPEGGGSPSAAAALHSAASVQSLRWSEEVLAEARTRLVAGLKRYFHSKRGEGLLSAQGLRILSYACDLAIDSQQPLDIWTVAEQEAVGKYRIKLLAWAFFRTKRLTGRLPRWLRWPLMPLLRWVSGMIGSVLSVTMLVASEVAVEYWLALSWSPQAQWLRESQQASPLQEEIARESRRVCKFIIDREIEAPERFQSIQSYRAAMAILRQQSAFIEELYSSGIVNEAEQQAMQEPVQRRARQLEIRGPVWRAPSVREVLRGLPFLTHLAEPLFEALLDRGSLLEFSRGEEIWPGAAGRGGAPSARGLMIVVYGLVRSSFTDPRGAHHEFFLGSGGMLGLLSALTGHPMPGSGPAIAEANALGKGPVAFHLPQSMIRRVRQRAAAGDHDYGQLELDLFRVAGLYVVERLKGQVQAGLAAEYQRYAVDRARRQAISRAAAACAASATRVAGSPPAGPTDKVAAVAAPRVPLSDAEVLGQLDRGRLWRSSQAFARDVLAEIRRQLRDAELVQLAPKQPYRQRSHLLLMQGSLGHTGGAASSSGTRSGGLGKPALPDLSAPAILPWLAGHMQPGPTWAAAAGALPVSQHAAAAAASAPPLTAGSSGALLLACPEPGEEPPSSPSSDSASDLGSPFAPRMPSNPLWNGQQEAQPTTGPEEEAQQGETLDTGGMWAPELEPQPSEAGERRQGRGQPLSPAGRPLHRVRSRRLPISAAWPTLETTP